MTSQVCVAASLVVAMFVPGRFSRAALTLWREWTLNDRQVIAPMLLRYEVTSAIYRKTLSGQIAAADGREALQRFLELDITTVDPPSLSLRAVEVAAKFQRPNTYEAHHLALVESQGCPIWTGDEAWPTLSGTAWVTCFGWATISRPDKLLPGRMVTVGPRGRQLSN